MASALYTVQFLTVQGLGGGERVSVYVVNLAEPMSFVIRDIAVYCGNPDGLNPVSIVLIPGHSDSGFPTAWGYDSGANLSVQPIYVHDSVSITTKTYQPLTGQQLIFYLANTSQAVGTFDVTISGWALPGTPAAAFEFSIP